MAQTVIPVMYRDSSNWKTHGRLVALGVITPGEIEKLRGALDRGEHYLPLQLGLDYYGTDWSGYDPDDLDHPWHEMLLDEITIAEEGDDRWFGTDHVEHVGPVSEFITRIVAASSAGWDENRYAPDAS